MLSKAPTFEGYILAFFTSLSELWSHQIIDEKRAYVKDVCYVRVYSYTRYVRIPLAALASYTLVPRQLRRC